MSEVRSADWIDVALDEAILRCDELGQVREWRGPAGLLPAPAEALTGRRVAEIDTLPVAMRDAWTRTFDRCADTQRPQICDYALERDGVTKVFEARMLPVGDGATAIAIRDVGERNRLRQRVEYLALHDTLTGLGNTRTLRERLGRWLDATAPLPATTVVAVLIVDLDRFRQTNDLAGRAVGDSLLRLVAQRMRREVELHTGTPSDDETQDVVVVRLGGDQFALAWRLDDGGDPAEERATERVDALALRLIAALSAPTRIAGRTLFVRSSIGLALYPRDARDASSLFSHADAALVRAKQAGRNQFRRHGDDRIERAALQPPSTEAALRDALTHGEFRLVYQPKFELASSLSIADATQRGPLAPGAVIAVEALCRWRAPSGALLGPQHFLPLAETTGLIRPLGDWVLRQALSEVTHFAERGAVRVGLAVNVSLSQLHDRTFVEFVAAALREHGVAPAELTMEISEAAFTEDFRLVADALAELSSLGVRLAIDHFGIGTAGLVALKSLPVDELKIDRSFIAGAAIDLFDATIVAGLIELGHNLGMTVTAEGVERVDQIATLAKLRCDAIQGFFVGEPAAADVLVADAALWRKTRAARPMAAS